MKILIIDNYDSFTFNLYQYVGEILKEKTESFQCDVYRNNKITLNKIIQSRYQRIIISPGPGSPSEKEYFGVCADVITKLKGKIPTLGVCLGLQGIGYYFGAEIVQAKKIMHGKTSLIEHDGKGVFKGLPQNLEVMRYHSLIARPESVPDCLLITARSQDDGEIMGLRHKQFALEGIQFHPESFASEGGKSMLRNFLF